MYNETYDDYIRSILGYPVNSEPMNVKTNNISYSNQRLRETNKTISRGLEEYYPEIYKLIYPMIKKACMRNIRENRAEEIEQITKEIYEAIENDFTINININLENDRKPENRNYEAIKKDKENRNIKKNQGLYDLIKILLIRELTDGNTIQHRPNPYNRPVYHPYHQNVQNRDPNFMSMRQNLNTINDIYEN